MVSSTLVRGVNPDFVLTLLSASVSRFLPVVDAT